MNRPFFMAIEGTDKSGKTTVAAKVMQRLLAMGIPVTLVQEPGSTRIGEKVRKAIQEVSHLQPLTEAFLFEAARHEMTETRVKPALARGSNVITIRYTASTTVYQGYAGGGDREAIAWLNDLATGGLEPDETVILDAPIKETRARDKPDQGAFESRADTFYDRVRAGYLELAARRPHSHRVIDARQDREVVVDNVLKIALGLIERKESQPSGKGK